MIKFEKPLFYKFRHCIFDKYIAYELKRGVWGANTIFSHVTSFFDTGGDENQASFLNCLTYLLQNQQQNKSHIKRHLNTM